MAYCIKTVEPNNNKLHVVMFTQRDTNEAVSIWDYANLSKMNVKIKMFNNSIIISFETGNDLLHVDNTLVCYIILD